MVARYGVSDYGEGNYSSGTNSDGDAIAAGLFGAYALGGDNNGGRATSPFSFAAYAKGSMIKPGQATVSFTGAGNMRGSNSFGESIATYYAFGIYAEEHVVFNHRGESYGEIVFLTNFWLSARYSPSMSIGAVVVNDFEYYVGKFWNQPTIVDHWGQSVSADPVWNVKFTPNNLWS